MTINCWGCGQFVSIKDDAKCVTTPFKSLDGWVTASICIQCESKGKLSETIELSESMQILEEKEPERIEFWRNFWKEGD